MSHSKTPQQFCGKVRALTSAAEVCWALRNLACFESLACCFQQGFKNRNGWIFNTTQSLYSQRYLGVKMKFLNPAEASGKGKYWNVFNNLGWWCCRAFSLCAQHCTLVIVITHRKGTERTEPVSSQWCPVPEKEMLGTNWNAGGSDWTSRSSSVQWGWPSTGAGCPEKL